MRHHLLQEPVRTLGLAVALSSMILIGCHDEAPVPTTPLTVPTAPQPPTPVGLQLSPHELRLVQGESGEYELLLAGSAYTYQVAIGLGGVPEGVMAVQELHHLAVTIPATAPVGTYPLTVTGSRSNAASDTTTGLLTIVAATSPFQPNLQVWVDDVVIGESVWAVAGGSYTWWYVKVKRGGGFTGAVSLSVEGLQLGASASFDPPTVEPGHASTWLRLSAATAGLESNITIRARGEGVPDATATYRFVVAPAWQH